MFCLLLLVSEMGMLAAQLNSTDQTVTISKDFTEPPSINETVCTGCNNICLLPNRFLQEFPACLPSYVQVIDLAFNNLEVINEEHVANLSELRNLSLANNQINKIIWVSNVLPQLESLDLSNNQLSTLPACLMLKKVHWLSLAGNPISSIPELAFTSFPNLIFLNLSSTQIGRLSSADIDGSAFALNATVTQTDSLKSLEVLDLSATYLRGFNETWSKDLPNLKELYIRNMINMKRLEDELLKWFPQLEILTCAGSQQLSYVRTEIFENASQLKSLSFHNCSLTSFPPWNVTSGFVAIDLSENPLECECEIDWLLSDPQRITLLRANETYCNTLHGDLPPISLVGYHKICQLSQKKPTENAMQDFTLSTPTNNITDTVTRTQKDSVTATPKTQKMEQIPYIPESVTVFKTTESDSTILSPEAQTSTDKEAITILDTGSTISMNSIGGPSTDSKYPTASTWITKEFTSPEGSIKAGSGQPIPEDSSNEVKAGSPVDYDYDDEESKPKKSTAPSPISACDYDGCKHLQTPCTELQKLTQCMCPGLSGEDIIPDPPYLNNISEITDTSAQIHWCSPNSEIEKYQLVYQSGGQNKTVDNIYVTMRQYTLYNLSPYTTYKVCMVAFNKEGQSEAENVASRTPCAEFKTMPSYIMILAVLCGLGGLFLVIITVLAAFLYKTCKNNMVNQYDTHLVSYKNPAFEYHLTIPSYH